MMLKIKKIKIINKELYDKYTKKVIGFHQYYPSITKQQLYDVFKFHCANQRILNEVVDYIYGLIKADLEKVESEE